MNANAALSIDPIWIDSKVLVDLDWLQRATERRQAI